MSTEPQFNLLKDKARRERLIALRGVLEPLLAKEHLPYFTDHSVSHADEVCQMVDTIFPTAELLPEEAHVLYQACYLHDIGMHVNNIRQTRVFGQIAQDRDWDKMSDSEKSAVLRDHHAEISAELVSNDKLALGKSWTFLESEHAGSVAALCAAHTLDTNSALYEELIGGQDYPSMRLSLLSAMLRLADIFQETSTRATREVREILDLPLDSAVHWYRHHFTQAVYFDRQGRVATVRFEYGPDQAHRYHDVI